jgi:hypothetical protein
MRMLPVGVVLVLLGSACSDEAPRQPFPLRIRGVDLVRRGTDVPVLTGVTYDTALSSAYVR